MNQNWVVMSQQPTTKLEVFERLKQNMISFINTECPGTFAETPSTEACITFLRLYVRDRELDSLEAECERLHANVAKLSSDAKQKVKRYIAALLQLLD